MTQSQSFYFLVKRVTSRQIRNMDMHKARSRREVCVYVYACL